MLVRADDHPAADHVGGCIGPDLAVGLLDRKLSRYSLARRFEHDRNVPDDVLEAEDKLLPSLQGT